MDPPLLNMPPPNGDAEPPDSTIPELIEVPIQVEGLLKLLQSQKLQCIRGQDSPVQAYALERKMPLGMAHGRPPDPINLYT